MRAYSYRDPMRSTRGIIVLLVMGLAAAGCSSDSGDDSQQGDGSGEDSGAFAELLGVVPDTAANREQIYLGNWATAADLAHQDQPENAEAVVDYVLEVQEGTDLSFNPNVVWLQEADDSEGLEEQLGFHLGQVDASIVAGAPPEHVLAFRGRFDVDAIAEAIEADPEWSDLLEVVEHGGTEYFSWDDEPEPGAGEPGPRDQLGRGGNMYVTEDELWWSFSAEGIEGMIDAQAGDAESLADDDDVRSVAEELDALGAFSASITETDGSDYGVPLDGTGDDRSGPTVATYELLATGAYAESSDLLGVVILVNEDEATAEENVERLTEVIRAGESAVNPLEWADEIDIESIDRSGNLTIATVDIEGGPRLLLDAVFRRDSLYASSED